MPLIFTPETWDSELMIMVEGTNDDVQTADWYSSTLSHTVSSSDPLFQGTGVEFFPSSQVYRCTDWLV